MEKLEDAVKCVVSRFLDSVCQGKFEGDLFFNVEEKVSRDKRNIPPETIGRLVRSSYWHLTQNDTVGLKITRIAPIKASAGIYLVSKEGSLDYALKDGIAKKWVGKKGKKAMRNYVGIFSSEVISRYSSYIRAE